MDKKNYYHEIANELAIGIIILVAIAVGTVFYLLQNKISSINSPVQISKVNYAKKKQINKIIYINNEFGFELVLPKEWEDYKTAKDGNSIRFAFPTADENWTDPYFDKGYAEIFAISAEGKSDWTKRCATFCKKEPGAPLCGDCTDNPIEGLIGIKKLGIGSEYVYAIHMAQNVPNDFDRFFCKNCNTGEFFDYVINKIATTFKFTK